MARTAPIALAIILALAFASDARSTKKEDEVERIGGIILYRVQDGRIEYLLLKKAKEDDWSPPKGHVEADNESEIDAALRETREETGLNVVADYDVYIQYKIYFDYVTKNDVLKLVHLWPAALSNFDKPIELSPENSEYAWLPYDQALARIKSQYRVALTQGDNIIRAHEQIANKKNLKSIKDLFE